MKTRCIASPCSQAQPPTGPQRLYLIALFSCIFWALPLSAGVETKMLEISSERSQQVKYWGAFPSYHRNTYWREEFQSYKRPEVLKLLYNELGINIIRVDLPPDYYDPNSSNGLNVAHSMDLVHHISAAQQNGINEWIAAIWSPPASFKEPADVNGHIWRRVDTKQKVSWFDGIGKDPGFERVEPKLRADKEDAFVAHIVNLLGWLKPEVGLPLNLSIQNEPHHAPSYDGTNYPAQQYRRVSKKMRRALDAAGMQTVGLVGNDGNHHENPFISLGDDWLWTLNKEGDGDDDMKGVFNYVAAHSYDFYWGAGNMRRVEASARLKNMLDFYYAKEGIEFWMTEFSIDAKNANSQFENSIRATRTMVRDLVDVGFHAWIWWRGYTMAEDPAGHLQSLVTGSTVDNSLKLTPLYHIFRHLWNSAPGGSHVRKVNTDAKDILTSGHYKLDAVAFESDTGLTLLLVNPDNYPKNVLVKGFNNIDMANIYMATEGDNMSLRETREIVGDSFQITLQPKSVLIATGATIEALKL